MTCCFSDVVRRAQTEIMGRMRPIIVTTDFVRQTPLTYMFMYQEIRVLKSENLICPSRPSAQSLGLN